MYIHDDNDLIFEPLYKCVDFLDSNPEYSGVEGGNESQEINDGLSKII